MLIQFLCEKCKKTTIKSFKKSKDIPDNIDCECGDRMERQLQAPNSRSVEVIDNGKQQRQVVIDKEIVEREREKVERKDKENDRC